MFSPGIGRGNSYCIATANMGNIQHSLMMEFIKRTQESGATWLRELVAACCGVGAPERIRTSDPQIRSLVLYPAELRARDGPQIYGHRKPVLEPAANETAT